jgi:hypothetical protein
MELIEWLFQPDGRDGWIEEPDVAFDPIDLMALFESWHEAMAGKPAAVHNKCVWRAKCEPLWVGMTYAGSKRYPLEVRKDLVRSMRHVTLAIPALHLPGEPMENGYYMWWHTISKELLDDPTRQVCLDVLTELCNHSDSRIQAAALHGLGHLHWPGTGEAVQHFIDTHPDTRLNSVWLEQCRNGSVM